MFKFIKLYATLIRTFGFRLRPLATFVLFQVKRLFNLTTRGLDHLFFPAIRKVAIERPIFILGNPRGGRIDRASHVYAHGATIEATIAQTQK